MKRRRREVRREALLWHSTRILHTLGIREILFQLHHKPLPGQCTHTPEDKCNQHRALAKHNAQRMQRVPDKLAHALGVAFNHNQARLASQARTSQPQLTGPLGHDPSLLLAINMVGPQPVPLHSAYLQTKHNSLRTCVYKIVQAN